MLTRESLANVVANLTQQRATAEQAFYRIDGALNAAQQLLAAFDADEAASAAKAAAEAGKPTVDADTVEGEKQPAPVTEGAQPDSSAVAAA